MSLDSLKSAAANTASAVTNKVLTGASAVSSGVANAVSSVQSKVTAATSGLTNLGTNISGAIPGLSSNLTSATSMLSSSQRLLDFSLPSDNKVTVDASPPFPNVLYSYASFNTIFTLSVLPDTHINNPDDTYRSGGDIGPIILKSASGAADDDLVETAYGKIDFIMDNVRINGMMGLNSNTGNSNAVGISFTVIEPYSMGLFFQVLQVAAHEAGYKNYLDVPILLTIQFVGHTDTELNARIPYTKRMIPMKLRHVGMRVTSKGSTYDVEAYPWNEQAFSDTYSRLHSDISIACDPKSTYTVQDLLQKGENSLQNVINKRFKKIAEEKIQEHYDEVVIVFPSEICTAAGARMSSEGNESSDRGATSSALESSTWFQKLGLSKGANDIYSQDTSQINPIGSAPLGLNAYNKGDTVFANSSEVYDKATGIYKRGSMQIDLMNANYKFPQGATIPDVINQVILSSDYGRQALEQANRSGGRVLWWRIETQFYIKPLPEDSKSGTKPKMIVYRVVPYAVDASADMAVNQKTPALEEKKKQALKEYNYLYSGKNVDIIDFEIDFNIGFYRALNADGGRETEGQKVVEQTSASGVQPVDKVLADASGAPPGINSQTVKHDRLQSKSARNGGTGVDSAATVAARLFHEVITEGHDMINANMTILGDPYYITDTGLGNYSAQQTNFENINVDGAMDYQTGEVLVSVNFRTPIDINMQTGFYDFGDTQPVPQFSGLFRVLGVESIFNRGKFTQNLQLVRIPGQENTNAPEGRRAEALNRLPGNEEGADAFMSDESAIADLEAQSAGTESSITDQEIAANQADLRNSGL